VARLRVSARSCSCSDASDPTWFDRRLYASWRLLSSACVCCSNFESVVVRGESFYRAALEHDPALLDVHASARVVLASPTTLITLLRAIAVGWREEKVAESARSVSELGRELYERLATMADHFATVGKRLDGAVQAYNQTVGSLERRVLVSARKFPEHGIGTDKQIVELAPVDRSTQQPQTIELPSRSTADAA